MILLDYSQVSIAAVLVQLGNHTNIELNTDLLRHIVLNTIRFNRKQFHQEYGEVIICCDHFNSWRRDVFKHYKASRKRSRSEDELDWGAIFQALNTIRDELREFFPYPVLHVPSSEADDIISTMCQQHGVEFGTIREKILILSGDKDFGQLQRYSNVSQYNPIMKKKIEVPNPSEFLLEHIIRGDPGDGIPNMLSDDDTFVDDEKRNVRLTQKRYQELKEIITSGKISQHPKYDNYLRNEKLIDLRHTPKTICDETIEQYKNQVSKDRSKIFNYFISRKLVKHLDKIGDF